MPARVFTATASAPGAVAIIQVRGDGLNQLLLAATGVSDWPLSRVRFVHFKDIDAGLAVMLRDDWAQLMPHGGPRVVQRIIEALIACGATHESVPPAREIYPEAASDLEGDMLAAIARAASPAAIDLLLQQPARWQALLADAGDCGVALARARDQAAPLQRLIDPPTVVVIGQPNVGKSTLTNRMLGRAASIVADLPGTTRDWVAGLAEIGGSAGSTASRGVSPRSSPASNDATHRTIAVRWMDTPGLRHSDDAVEQRAIELANQVIAMADVLIVMRDPRIDWPAPSALPRSPDIWVMNKTDAFELPPCPAGEMHGDHAATPLRISAQTGTNIDQLEDAIIRRLGLGSVPTGPLAFSAALCEMVESGDIAGLHKYAGL